MPHKKIRVCEDNHNVTGMRVYENFVYYTDSHRDVYRYLFSICNGWLGWLVGLVGWVGWLVGWFWLALITIFNFFKIM